MALTRAMPGSAEARANHRAEFGYGRSDRQFAQTRPYAPAGTPSPAEARHSARRGPDAFVLQVRTGGVRSSEFLNIGWRRDG